MNPISHSRKHRGFTLVEVLVALALVSVISVVLMGALGPWMNLKQRMDTERRLQDIHQGMTNLYGAQAMAVEALPGGTFKEFVSSAPDSGSGGCAYEATGFSLNQTWFSEPSQAIARDGYNNPWCLRITNALMETRDGAPLWYRNVAIISTGPDGRLDPTTVVDAAGVLKLGGDDSGITVSGREIQAEKLKETLRRMTRIGQTYETYFTVRYLANAARDITIDYFSATYDTSGSVLSTGGAWAGASTALASIGIAGQDGFSAWEVQNVIQVGNYNEQENGVRVRSPASTGTGSLPFTALLRARVPSPAGSPAYVIQGVIGNY